MDVYQMTTKSEGMMIPGKLKWYAILTLALWLAFSGVAAAEQLYVNESGWWREACAFNASDAPIQAAVDNATAGDSVIVWNGSYTETVVVDTAHLTLEGEGAEVVSVSAKRGWDKVFEVTAGYVSISGFKVTGDTGFYLHNADHCGISNNNASNNRWGIYAHSSNDNMFVNNLVNSNSYKGIYLGYSGNNTLIDNTMSGNLYNFGVGGSTLFHHTHNIDTSNTVDGKPIYYWVDKRDMEVPYDAGFVGVVNSTNITVRDLTLTNSRQGVLFTYTENSRIINVNTSNNVCGIWLRSSSNNTMQDNIINSSDHCGICLISSNDNTLANNTANSSSSRGILLISSSSNMLTNNTASNNDCGIYLESSNGNTLHNNTVNLNSYKGICIESSSNNKLMSNTANSNDGHGIYMLFSSNHNQLVNNTASENRYGIYLGHSSSNMLQNNTMSGNSYNFGVDGYDLSDHIQNIDTSNTVDGKPIYYWIDKKDMAVPDNAGFVGVVNSTNITVRDLILTKNRDGVLFVYTDNSKIENVTANLNSYGIDMYYSSGNTLMDNTASSNNFHGIYLKFLNDNNTLTNSIANSNGKCGIYLYASSGNNITCNWVQNNTEQGFDLRNTGNNISYNNIIENGNYNTETCGWEWQLYNVQSNSIEIKHNYWGAGMNNSTIDASIYDDDESSYLGEVEFYPFETEPVPCAPTPEVPHTFTTTDAVIALQIASGSRPLDMRWDVSRDDRVTSLDALMTLQAAAHAIDL
ncbi:MAG: hypothetical protein C4B59_10790 [Candidatus Methanogaster sp.]|uniref:Uncharacterized protein n=1 Tax=Candidatus Methanogaster sp. TaxID=3386292 RepID=A0AC61L179_9EURY|nr:MAG: hypothetical protein C4B59_10790 [ANME-2 cluster archaeon]